MNKTIKKAASHLKTICLLFLVMGSKAVAQEQQSNLHVGFCYPLSTNGSRAGEYVNQVSFHVLAGVSRAEKAFGFAGISNVVRDRASGFQFAGISNTVKNQMDGFQFAGIVNRVAQAKGFQFAGIHNDVDSFQGFQFAGFSNVVTESMSNFQFAGFGNYVGSRMDGAQISGFINKAKDVDGFQFAGFINIAKKVRGLQFAGFINIADSSDHSLAIINIVKKGEMGVSASIDEAQTSLLTFRSGGRVLYGLIGAGYNWKLKDNYLAFEAGFGAHIPFSNSFRINAELAQQYIEDWKDGEYFKSTFRLLPAVRLGRSVELFGGPSMNFSQTDMPEAMGLVKNDLWHEDTRKGRRNQLFLGYQAGIQLKIK
ncbi:hypothetical protein [Arcticibacter sp. MXS-1]|uniref:hypothetical protein n=1 Tax=Arcticibacter sp. MXS-1 TaxID=3341726 RepID=UPI0035A84731